MKINKVTKECVEKMTVQIRNTPVDLKHNFVLVPLAYNKETCDWDQIELDVSRKAGKTPCVGQSLNKFIDYNNLVNLEVSLAYPTSHDQLLDLNIKLAMKVQNTSSTIHGKSHKTVKYEFCDSNNPKDKTLMNDRTRLDYFVSIILWVKRNYESETRKKMTLKKVPAKKNGQRLTPYYN